MAIIKKLIPRLRAETRIIFTMRVCLDPEYETYRYTVYMYVSLSLACTHGFERQIEAINYWYNVTALEKITKSPVAVAQFASLHYASLRVREPPDTILVSLTVAIALYCMRRSLPHARIFAKTFLIKPAMF